jgi:PTS system mannose-specific IID component
MSRSLDAGLRLNIFARLMLLQAAWSFERMQGLGFAFALEPWLGRLYPDAEARTGAVERHAEYFNTQPYVASLIVGLVCRMEEDAAALPADKRAAAWTRLRAVKKASASALAGLGDAFFWGALRPAAAAAAVCAALLLAGLGRPLAAAAAGAAVYLAVYNVPALWVRWRGLALGYEWGETLPARLKEYSAQAWISRARAGGAVLAVAALGLLCAAAEPEERVPGLAACAAALAAYRFLPVRVSGMRLYAASCAFGLLLAAGKAALSP